MAIGEKLYTVDEFEGVVAQSPDRLIELIDGRIVEKVTSEEHGKIVINIGGELRLWLKQSPDIQGHYSTETSYRPEGDETNERRPDVSFRYSSQAVSKISHIVGMPDFAVEIKSRTNTYDELREKAHFYISHGTRLVWLIYPNKRIVEVYYADNTSELFTEDDTLVGGEVLPAFVMTVRDIFDN